MDDTTTEPPADVGRAAVPAGDTVVQKFGGSSLADPDGLHRAAGCAAASHRAGQRTVVVVSARGDTTDDLLELAARVGGVGVSARESDQLLATGECASAALLAMALRRLGVPATSLTGVQAGIKVTGRHGAGVVSGVDTRRLVRLLDDGHVVVVGGFHGGNDVGDIVTLGRGGSDTTAVAVAAALGASRCEIYTDVDGICTADPRLVPEARRLRAVDVSVMAEMAFAGARVLHSRAVELLAASGLELHVRSSLADGSGTVVTVPAGQVPLETANAVVAVTHDFDVARVLVRGDDDLAPDVLDALAQRAVPVDLVARSGTHEDEFRMGFIVRRGELAEVGSLLSQVLTGRAAELHINEDVAKISLAGVGLLSRPEYAARAVAALAAAGIGTGWIWTSQFRLSVIVALADGPRAVDVLHREFGLQRDDAGLDLPVIA
jgi:aspartate kinase